MTLYGLEKGENKKAPLAYIISIWVLSILIVSVPLVMLVFSIIIMIGE